MFLGGFAVFALTGFLIWFFLRQMYGQSGPQRKTGAKTAPKKDRPAYQPSPLEALKRYDKTAVYRIEDPETLYEIAAVDFEAEDIFPRFYHAPDSGSELKEWQRSKIRLDNARAAVDRLEDPALLEKLVRQAGRFAEYAAEKLCRLLPETAPELSRDASVSPGVRKAAILAMTDQEELKELYRENEDEELRLAALSGLSDQPFLEEVAEHGESAALRTAAAGRITDPGLREKYCREYGAHDWVFVEEERTECGEYLDIDDIYRCRYCGEQKRESHERIRM